MNVPPELFDENYLYFYADVLGAERSDADAEVVAKLLSLRPGMRVLDVPCGDGRIAGRLVERGCEVVGLDSNQSFLALARERYPNATFAHGDMRALPYQGEFDAVVNWFTSFGYFDPATNDLMLAGFARALRPGGQVGIELHNAARLARLLELAGGSIATVTERNDDLMVDRVSTDPGHGRSRTERFVVRDGKVSKLEFSLEQVPGPRLVRRLQDAGFSDVRLFGRGGERFEPEGPRVIAIGRRAGSGGVGGARAAGLTYL